MKNAPAKSAGKKVTEIEPFDKRSVDFTKFKSDLTAKELQKLFGPKGGLVVFPFGPIETLSSTKTIGRGRTNLTIIMSTIVQIDSTVPGVIQRDWTNVLHLFLVLVVTIDEAFVI